MLELFVALMLQLALSLYSLLSGACLDMVDIPTAEVVSPYYTVALLFLTEMANSFDLLLVYVYFAGGG